MSSATPSAISTPFIKMHGLRNHFVIVDARAEAYRPDVEEIVRICDPQVGVGADQLVVLEPPQAKEADVFMRLYNVDGREVGACGNATRCVAWLLLEEAGTASVSTPTLSAPLMAVFFSMRSHIVLIRVSVVRLDNNRCASVSTKST